MNGNSRIRFSKKFVFIGFGCIAKAVIPLLLRHVEITPDQIIVISAEKSGQLIADSFQITLIIKKLTNKNFTKFLSSFINQGDFLINVSVNVSSIELIKFCNSKKVLYLDTCIEPWHGQYTNPRLAISARTNYNLREELLLLRRRLGCGSTAVVTHGANPGIISHFVKQALINIAQDTNLVFKKPGTQSEWAQLAKLLNIKVIQCAESDTQNANPSKRFNEFVNTWSVEGFVAEGCQPAELGWGSHEKHMPFNARKHKFGCQASIFLEQPGMTTRVRSWIPYEEDYHGFLITHGESISIADYFSVKEYGIVNYRPTVFYAYKPCDATFLSVNQLYSRNFKLQTHRRILMDEIYDGTDSLGVLIMGHTKKTYWYGSVLSIQEARKLAPNNNATSLQVAAGIIGGVIWTIENPEEGIVEPEEMPFEYILEIARPYLGKIIGQYSNWSPLIDRNILFKDDVDINDQWQFKNFLVT